MIYIKSIVTTLRFPATVSLSRSLEDGCESSEKIFCCTTKGVVKLKCALHSFQ